MVRFALLTLLLVTTTTAAAIGYATVEDVGSTHLGGLTRQQRKGEDSSNNNYNNNNAQKMVPTLTEDKRTFIKPITEDTTTQPRNVPTTDMQNTPNSNVQMIPMDKQLTEDSRTFITGINEMNLLGVITMDQDSVDVFKAALEASTEFRLHLGQWFVDEPVSQQYWQYLVLLQDPVDHLVTSWHRHHEAYVREVAYDADLRTDFYKCFPDLEEFAYTGLAITEVPNDCQKLAQQVASGEFHDNFFGAFYYHHGYHLEEAVIEAHKPVYVVRQEDEHIMNDVLRIHNMVLGQPSSPTLQIPTYTAPTLDLSEDAMANLCRTLCRDIQIYKKVIQQSMNLGDFAYTQAQTHVATSCPEQAMLDMCPSTNESDEIEHHSSKEAGKDALSSTPGVARSIANTFDGADAFESHNTAQVRTSDVGKLTNDAVESERRLKGRHQGEGRLGSYLLKYLEEGGTPDS